MCAECFYCMGTIGKTAKKRKNIIAVSMINSPKMSFKFSPKNIQLAKEDMNFLSQFQIQKVYTDEGSPPLKMSFKFSPKNIQQLVKEEMNFLLRFKIFEALRKIRYFYGQIIYGNLSTVNCYWD